MADGRWMMWLCAAGLFMIQCLVFTSCKTEDDTIIYKDSRRWVEKTVAVVAPLNDPIMKTRLERTAEWMLKSLHNAQLHDTLCIDLKLEWYDEYGNDLKSLSERLANRDDLLAVIGPFDSDNVEQLAPYCQQTNKPLILPTATSETVIRRFAITSTGNGQKPFLWSLTETDVSLSEVMVSLYANFLAIRGGTALNSEQHSGLFAPASTYGQTFVEWAPFQAAEVGITFATCEQYTSTDDLLVRARKYYEFMRDMLFLALEVPHFIVALNEEQIYQIARMRSEVWNIDPDDPSEDDPGTLDVRVAWAPVYYACSNLTEEGIAALGDRCVALTSGYQGFSPYADPMTGFEMSYETRFGTKPTFAECKFYDALLLAAFASNYMEHHREVANLNDAIIDICTTDNFISGYAWSETGMELYLAALEQGTVTPQKQDEALATHTSKIDKTRCPVDFTQPSQQIHNQIRGLYSWPVATAVIGGKRVKLHGSRLAQGSGAAGTVLSVKPLVIACGEGAIEITELQPEGKKKMTAEAFALGHRLQKGDSVL